MSLVLKKKRKLQMIRRRESVPGTEKDMSKGKVTKASMESSDKCIYFV